MLKLTTGKHITEDIQRAMDSQCPEAYNRLMDENIDMVRRVVYRIVLNEHDTDDVVQEAFVKAFQKMKSFKGVAKFSSWLCRIAYNEAYMFLRKKDDKQVVGDQLHVIAGSDSLRADSAIKTKETHEEIMQALETLPEEQRAAITLTALEGKSVKEAAYILNCNQMTLYWRLQQTRKHLGKQLMHLRS